MLLLRLYPLDSLQNGGACFLDARLIVYGLVASVLPRMARGLWLVVAIVIIVCRLEVVLLPICIGVSKERY